MPYEDEATMAANEEAADCEPEGCCCGVGETLDALGVPEAPVQGDFFFFHRVESEEERAFLHEVRAQFRSFRDALVEVLPDCRERSVAITHLQTAMMFAICAGIRSCETATAEL